jgi:ubiquinone/menaquinone biosynthesis C-methylase UbiE
MTALDVGCGMGFFTLPMAQMVGTTGKVVAGSTSSRSVWSVSAMPNLVSAKGR